MYEEEESSWSFTIGVFVGAIAGAVLASLFTPRSGAQNRDAVRERGLVLKERVSDRTHSATSNVKGTASGYVSSIKDTTSSVTSSVRETAHSVRETASSATATVKSATHTAVERVGETVETIRERASATAASVSETANTTVGKLQETASTAAERARHLRHRDHDDDSGATLPAATTLAAEARYDAKDVRPASATEPSASVATGRASSSTVTSSAPSATTSSAPSSSRTDPLQVLSSLDTFEPTMADVTAATPAQPIDERAASAAANELSSDEQFDVADTSDQSRARGETNNPPGASKPSADADREA